MADTSFADGDLFIGLGDAPPSPGPSSRPSRPPPGGRATPAPAAGKSKKRKGGEGGSAEKRRKHKKSPEPRPKDRTGPQNLKEERQANSRNAPWSLDVDWDACRDPAEM